MQLQGRAYRVSIYIGEDDQFRGRPLYMALLELLKKEGAPGATVTRGVAGFGANSRIHTANILTLSGDLPIIVEWVDVAERIDRLLPQVRSMVDDGLITRSPVEVVQYASGRWPDPLDQPVRHIMRTEVASVGPQTSLAEAVSLLLARGYRSLPVVDDHGRLLGIITDGDLLRRAGLSVRLGLQSDLSREEVLAQVTAMQQTADVSGGLTAQAIMTTDVVTLTVDDSVRKAVARMAKHNLKRLPVVDDQDRLVGLVSRVDVLRMVEYHQLGQGQVDSGKGGERGIELPHKGRTVVELMYTDVPTVAPDADLETILRALETTRRRRAVVVDGQRRVLGIITDGDLLRRSHTATAPGLLARLRRLINPSETVTDPLPNPDITAVQIMSSPAITITAATPLSQALHLMMAEQVKRLPVVDAQGRLIGLLGRASLLRGLLEEG